MNIEERIGSVFFRTLPRAVHSFGKITFSIATPSMALKYNSVCSQTVFVVAVCSQVSNRGSNLRLPYSVCSDNEHLYTEIYMILPVCEVSVVWRDSRRAEKFADSPQSLLGWAESRAVVTEAGVVGEMQKCWMECAK